MLMGKNMEGWWLYPTFMAVVGGWALMIGVGIGVSLWVMVPLAAFVVALVAWMVWEGYTLRKFCLERERQKQGLPK